MRNEEHQLSMELMRQRVRAGPLLLEGESKWIPNGKLSYYKLANSEKACQHLRNASKLSNYSDDRYSGKSQSTVLTRNEHDCELSRIHK